MDEPRPYLLSEWIAGGLWMIVGIILGFCLWLLAERWLGILAYVAVAVLAYRSDRRRRVRLGSRDQCDRCSEAPEGGGSL
jgi:hypothetical protein